MNPQQQNKVFLLLMLVFIGLVGIFFYKVVTNIELLNSEPCELCQRTTGRTCSNITSHSRPLEHNFSFDLRAVDLEYPDNLTGWKIKVIE